ncbi:hypothetical protein NX02_22885 [Sphingomonas sanxanigenens DSM 19645 = NX02]|uniref:DUF3806 domain-containing protein n=1 Tax=Sphingomonas sanxanigenens DSM 19645 = NX02 TaxID=1123269 RepID=W0AKI7_9SPHN|nr:hypothetical protein NX02_22885 [Sphingomonas sanxanigenens DSM 19645 = NX02]
MVADAKTSAAWIAEALTQSGYKADFSMASLTEIDRFFDEQSANGRAIPSGLLGEQLGSRLFAIGSYVGETLLRHRTGAWVGDDADPQGEINISIRFQKGDTIWPVQRVMRRYQNGREDGLAAYGAAVVSGELG